MNSYVLRIEGKKPYRFLETLVRSHINFIKRKETSTFCMIEVSVEDYAKIKKIHTSYDIIVVSRKGVPYFLYLWKKKKLFLSAIVMGLIFLTFLSYLTFDIKVIHTDKKIRELILEDLAEFGIKKYHFKVSYQKKEEIRDKILMKEKDSIEWLEIEEVGTMYQVKVIPRVKKEEEEELAPRNVVAKKSGLITSIEATTGEIVVKKNQYVEKGQVLITGIIKNKDEIKAFVPATGQVYAEVWYDVKMSLPLKYEEETKTGKEKKVLEISFLNFEFSLGDFDPYEHSKNTEQILWSHALLPFKISYTKKEELYIKTISYGEGDLLEKAEPLAIEKLKTKLGDDIEVIDRKVLKKTQEVGKIELELFFKIKEDITDYNIIEENSISSSENPEES